MKIGKVEVDKGLLLAPMEGITDLPFRIICRDMGADIVYSEFIASEALIRNARPSKRKMDISELERPVAIQMFGPNIDSLVESAKIIEDGGADIIDINMGCWVKKVVNSNAGAAMLKYPDLMAEMTRTIAEAVDVPVTVKTRLGWDHNSIVIHEVAPMLEQAGCKALAIHCRTRDMAIKGDADWSWIPIVKKAVKEMPIILNGDVKTPEDARRAFDETGCDAIMIGRAAVGNPFLFKRIRYFLDNDEFPAPLTVDERIDSCLEHLQLNIIYNGYPRGFIEFRKHYTGYLKGLYGASRIRQQLVRIDTFDEAYTILNDYRDYLNGFGDKLEEVKAESDEPELKCRFEL